MQYLGRFLNFVFLPVASNDNDDLLFFPQPSAELAFVRNLKYSLREENCLNGKLLTSRRERRFFQEVVDAERYIMLRYFSVNTPEILLRQLKRHILDTYLFPKRGSRQRRNH